MPKNNAKTWMIVSIVLTLIGAAMVWFGLTEESGDYIWMVMVGLLLGLTFFICFFIFLSQARRLNRMFNREELLAHWAFDPAGQRQKATDEYQARKKSNRILLMIVVGFFVVIGGLFTAFGFDDIEDAAGFLLIMLGVLVVICLAALIAPGVSYRKMLRSPPEVYVGPFGAWVMGEYVQWKAAMTRPTQVDFAQVEQAAVITVHYQIIQRYGPQMHECRIPVPAGSEQEAFNVANQIAAANGIGFLAK